MHEHRLLNFVHKFINNNDKLPDIFTSYFIQNRYETGRKCDLHLTNMQSTVGKKSITSKGCNLWNKLPDHLKLLFLIKLLELEQYYLQSI